MRISLKISENGTFLLNFGRMGQIASGLAHHMPLSVIILAGSSLEGILLDLATKSPKTFNQAKSTPKDSQSGNPKKFY